MEKVLIVAFLLCFAAVAPADDGTGEFSAGSLIEARDGYYFQAGIKLSKESVEKGLIEDPASAELMRSSAEKGTINFIMGCIGSVSAITTVVLQGPGIVDSGGAVDYVTSFLMFTVAAASITTAIIMGLQSSEDFKNAVDEYNKSLESGALKTGVVPFDKGALLAFKMEF